MIRNTQVLWPIMGIVLVSAALAGCGQNNAQTASAPTTTTTADTKAAPDDHAHAAGEAAHSHDGDAPAPGAQAPAELAAFFPGATMTKKAFPLSAADAAHMSGESGVQFSGAEKEWEVYEASQNGARSGYAVMTHARLSNGGDMHVMLAVDKQFKITRTNVADAPDEAKMKLVAAQAVGKNLKARFKVGQTSSRSRACPRKTPRSPPTP